MPFRSFFSFAPAVLNVSFLSFSLSSKNAQWMWKRRTEIYIIEWERECVCFVLQWTLAGQRFIYARAIHILTFKPNAIGCCYLVCTGCRTRLLMTKLNITVQTVRIQISVCNVRIGSFRFSNKKHIWWNALIRNKTAKKRNVYILIPQCLFPFFLSACRIDFGFMFLLPQCRFVLFFICFSGYRLIRKSKMSKIHIILIKLYKSRI